MDQIGFLVLPGHDHCDRCGDLNYDPETRICLSCTYPDAPTSYQPFIEAGLGYFAGGLLPGRVERSTEHPVFGFQR